MKAVTKEKETTKPQQDEKKEKEPVSVQVKVEQGKLDLKDMELNNLRSMRAASLKIQWYETEIENAKKEFESIKKRHEAAIGKLRNQIHVWDCELQLKGCPLPDITVTVEEEEKGGQHEPKPDQPKAEQSKPVATTSKPAKVIVEKQQQQKAASGKSKNDKTVKNQK